MVYLCVLVCLCGTVDEISASSTSTIGSSSGSSSPSSNGSNSGISSSLAIEWTSTPAGIELFEAALAISSCCSLRGFVRSSGSYFCLHGPFVYE